MLHIIQADFNKIFRADSPNQSNFVYQVNILSYFEFYFFAMVLMTDLTLHDDFPMIPNISIDVLFVYFSIFFRVLFW